jgi:RNA polymerase sigma factor (sigma-70 family)
MVLGLCRLLLRDPLEAEDAAQQVFLSAHQAILRGSPPRDRAAWMAAIARNECRARIRARMREPLTLPELPSDLPDPLAAAIRAADLKAVWVALGELPRRQRNAIVLRELGGLSYHELGRALGVSHSAIESLLFRARKRLRTIVGSTSAAALPPAWKLAGAAVSVGVVATGASGLQGERHTVAHPQRAAAPPVVPPVVREARRLMPVEQRAVTATPIVRQLQEHRGVRPVVTPHAEQRRDAEPADQPEPADQAEPSEVTAPKVEPAEPVQLDELDTEHHSGSDDSVRSGDGSSHDGGGTSGSDDGSSNSGPG